MIDPHEEKKNRFGRAYGEWDLPKNQDRNHVDSFGGGAHVHVWLPEKSPHERRLGVDEPPTCPTCDRGRGADEASAEAAWGKEVQK